MKVLILVLLVLILGIIIVGCTNEEFGNEITKIKVNKEIIDDIDESTGTEGTEENFQEEIKEKKSEFFSCNDTRECEDGQKCIDNICLTLEKLHTNEDVESLSPSECIKKCNYNQVKILTSDGETYILNSGEGSYTAAGALAWEILSSPDYCLGEELIVPIEFEKINYGEVLNTQILTLKEGETSEVITHPTSKSMQFTLKVEDVDEVCY